MVMGPRPKKLLDQLREVIRLKHYAYRTEETYVQWVKRYILFQKSAIRVRWGEQRLRHC